MISTPSSQLFTALNKNYEERNPKEHRLIFKSIASCFSSHTEEKIKMMAFYLEVRQGPAEISASEYGKHSFVLRFNEENSGNMQIITNRGVNVCEGQYVCILDYHKYLNVEALGDSSIEKEINFWESSEYFCSMPRKKLYQLLRQTQIREFKENQMAFFQGQLMTKTESGSGVFVVRKGWFGYFRSSGPKQIETFRFESGNIFGSIQILENDSMRAMTAKSKTQRSIIYHFSEQLFKRLMVRYCESVIRKRQSKLFRFVQKKTMDMIKSKSLSDGLKKAQQLPKNIEKRPMMMNTHFDSVQSLMLTDKKSSSMKDNRNTNKFSAFRQSLRIENQGMKRTDFFSLRKEGPLKNYPLASQRSNFDSSEFKVLQKLFKAKKEVGKQDLFNSNPIRENGTWKRDMIHSFYRQTFFQRVKKNPEQCQS